MVKNVDKNEWIGRRETDIERASGMYRIFLTAAGCSCSSITESRKNEDNEHFLIDTIPDSHSRMYWQWHNKANVL